MYTRLFIALVGCFLATAVVAQPILPGGQQAQSGGQSAGLQRVTAEDVGGILKALNLQIETIKLGDFPGLRINNWRGFVVGIQFYGCNADGCDSMQVLTTGKAPSHVTLQYVNNWNTKWRFTKLYLDNENNYHLDMDVVSKGGVTKDNIIANLGTYDWFLVELSGQKH